MSFCTVPTVAAKRQVAAPMKVTTPRAVELVSNMGERRHTINTPAVTLGAAWKRAGNGVGTSLTAGSPEGNPNCRHLPMAQIRKHTGRAEVGKMMLKLGVR